jgi:membrane-bound lytic murein transglycosylase D
MIKRLKYIFTGTAFLLLGGLFIFAMIEKRNAERQYNELFTRYYRVYTPEIPVKMDFAGEKVPLDIYYNHEILEREIIANTYMHSSTIMMFKRAYRWLPVIEPILKKNDIPDDFKFLALAESNLVNTVSPAGAEGFWQFLKPTGQKYGLEINEEVDERYNVEKATEAACKYFRDSYDQYKNWTLVAASFNRGPEGVRKAMENQKVSDFYDLYFLDETARYIFRILALKEIYNHPARYGYYLREQDFHPPIPMYTLKIDTAIADLPAFALKMKINYRILRELNPWIRRYSLPNKSKKTYLFNLPKEGSLKVANLVKNIPESETFFHDTLKIMQVN